MMKHRINSRSETGDTIIEVLLAVAVIGMVIGASYATANRALRTGRFAQEQTEAIKLAESQLEELKYIATLNPLQVPAPANIFDPTTPNFCVTTTFAKIAVSSASYAANCTNQGSGQLYTIVDNYVATPPVANGGGKDLFTITVTWPRLGTSDLGQKQIAYRLHR